MANEGKTVIVAALDGTFQRKEFGNILKLVPLAEHVVKLSAVCMICFGEGSYTKRTSNDQEVCYFHQLANFSVERLDTQHVGESTLRQAFKGSFNMKDF